MKKSQIILLRVIFTIMLLLTFYIIFSFSSQDGEVSEGTSTRVIEQIARRFTSNEEEVKSIVEKLDPVVRKVAHFSIYTLVGIWAMCLMSTFFIDSNKSIDQKTIYRIAIATIIGFLYACSDEFHQGLTPGRSPQVGDVFLDTLGVLNGALLVTVGLFINKKIKDKR